MSDNYRESPGSSGFKPSRNVVHSPRNVVHSARKSISRTNNSARKQSIAPVQHSPRRPIQYVQDRQEEEFASEEFLEPEYVEYAEPEYLEPEYVPERPLQPARRGFYQAPRRVEREQPRAQKPKFQYRIRDPEQEQEMRRQPPVIRTPVEMRYFTTPSRVLQGSNSSGSVSRGLRQNNSGSSQRQTKVRHSAEKERYVNETPRSRQPVFVKELTPHMPRTRTPLRSEVRVSPVEVYRDNNENVHREYEQYPEEQLVEEYPPEFAETAEVLEEFENHDQQFEDREQEFDHVAVAPHDDPPNPSDIEHSYHDTSLHSLDENPDPIERFESAVESSAEAPVKKGTKRKQASKALAKKSKRVEKDVSNNESKPAPKPRGRPKAVAPQQQGNYIINTGLRVVPATRVAAPSDDSVRRSDRTKVSPLAYWKNERVVYARRDSGIHVIKDIIRAPDSEPRRPWQRASTNHQPKREKHTLAPPPPEVQVFNFETKETEFSSFVSLK